MSYHTWSVDGYGFCSSDINTSVDKIRRLLLSAPKFDKEVRDEMFSQEIYAPELDDYLEYDQDEYSGLGYFLVEVIHEVEGISLCTANNFDGEWYVLYCPSYPWEQRTPKETNLTEEKIKEILSKYIKMLTDENIEITYQSVENGG